MDKKEVVGMGKVKKVYGIYIDVDDQCTKETIIKSLLAASEEVIEVAVVYRGEKKEFTFAEFFKRLGFHEKDAG